MYVSRSFGCLPEGALTLVEAQRFSFGHPDAAGRIIDAIWTVTAQQIATDGVAQRVYALRAMVIGTSESNERYTEAIADNLRKSTDEQGPWPLPVPAELLGSNDDAVTYVEGNFLDPEHPKRIADIRTFLKPQSE